MNTKQKIQIVNKLQTLLDTEEYPNEGICGFLYEQLGVDYEFVGDYARSWEHYSGVRSYPVKPFDELHDEITAFYKVENRWEGEYGNARKDLCRHIIKCLKEEIHGP
jgi:DNA-directed RNA polymerase delta subunit